MAFVAGLFAVVSRNWASVPAGLGGLFFSHRAINFGIGALNFRLESVVGGKYISHDNGETNVDREAFSKSIYRATFFFGGNLDPTIDLAIRNIKNGKAQEQASIKKVKLSKLVFEVALLGLAVMGLKKCFNHA